MVAAPVLIPVTTPAAMIAAVPGAPLLHTPPVVASLSVAVPPTHTFEPPVIAAGPGLTVNVALVVQLGPSE
jgi:hypothetical protein